MKAKSVVIVGIGHSAVVKENGYALPSGLYQDAEFPKLPNSFPFRRTGRYVEDIDPNGPRAYLGGGIVVVDAVMGCAASLAGRVKEARVVFIGGQSDYLKAVAPPDSPNLCEGEVMAEEAGRSWEFTGDISFVGGTRTTEDDVRATLGIAAKNDCDTVFLVAMSFRLMGVGAYLHAIANESPELRAAADKVVLVPAEMYFMRNSVALRPIEEMYFTEAYKRTAENENHRVRELLKGKNPTTGGKT